MDFALQAALLGAVMGAAVLAVSTIYGLTLPAAPGAFGWWAAAFVLESLSGGAVLAGGTAETALQVSDLLHAVSAMLTLGGALAYAGRSPGALALVAAVLCSAAWVPVAQEIRLRLGVLDVPLLGLGGVARLMAAWAFVVTHEQGRRDGHKASAVAFAAGGLHQLAGPVLHTYAVAAIWSFVFAQFLAMVTAVALLLVVLRRQQALAESEGQRAQLLHFRLIAALGSVQDGVALFDAADRLVTCNDRYRSMLGACEPLVQPGIEFRTLMDKVASAGVVPAAAGREGEWFEEMVVPAGACALGPVEMQLWDGRWLAASVYPTADGGRLRVLSDISNRKQAKRALEESLAWVRGIMDAVVDGLITIDEVGTVLSFNAAASRIFGYAADEVIGRNVGLLMPESERGDHDGYLDRFRATGEAHVIGVSREFLGRRKDGTIFPLELAVSQMLQGDFVTFIGVVRDITDRKRVEQALLDSESRFRDLAESASDWFWEIDANLRFTYVSSRVRHVLGVGPDFFLGRSFDELWQSGANRNGWARQQRVMRSRMAFRGLVVEQVLPSGETKYLEMAGRALMDARGEFHGYRGTASDISLLKRHETELSAQSSLRQAIIDNMAQGVAVFDGTGQLVALNMAARHLLDLPVGEVDPGMATVEAFLLYLAMQGELGEGEPSALVAEHLARTSAGPTGMFEFVRTGGMTLEVRTTPLPGGGVIQTFTDITERKRTELTLREAKEAAERGNRAKATFLANISHELRTPLNAIIGFSELMKHEIFGPVEPPSYRSYVDDINESGMHLLELINDILDMSKAEAGMTDLVETVVDVAGIVRSSVRMMARRAQANGVEIVEALPGDLPRLRADERRVRQIVLNLLSNAVKFTEDGGRVTIAAAVTAECYSIAVADTGIGMTAEDLTRVMEPFVQADNRLARKYEGTGLGLPLTRALTIAHGGRLHLESHPGEGTVVTVEFPLDRVADGCAMAGEASLRR